MIATNIIACHHQTQQQKIAGNAYGGAVSCGIEIYLWVCGVHYKSPRMISILANHA
jgi:hypothetical protein